jgi:predicted SAM-dependent methyltransferase
VAGDTDVLHLSLARRDYLRHPVLLSEILALYALRRLTSGPAHRALGQAIGELKVAVCDRQARAKLATAAGCGPHRLNVGCGEKPRPGWLNIDLDPRAELRLDIRRPLPFPEGSCAEIYSEHVLEHLAYPGEVEEVLRDWWRVLVPGGILSVGVPETAYPLASYVNRTDDYFVWCRTQPWEPPWIETRLDQINFHFRQQGLGFGQDHLYAYDVETLAARLTAAGFVDIAQRPYDPARDSRRDALHVDARKPGQTE